MVEAHAPSKKTDSWIELPLAESVLATTLDITATSPIVCYFLGIIPVFPWVVSHMFQRTRFLTETQCQQVNGWTWCREIVHAKVDGCFIPSALGGPKNLLMVTVHFLFCMHIKFIWKMQSILWCWIAHVLPYMQHAGWVLPLIRPDQLNSSLPLVDQKQIWAQILLVLAHLWKPRSSWTAL